jgi:hypothetical protein
MPNFKGEPAAMTENYGALCNDFMINQTIRLRMDLGHNREAVMGLFERVRKDFPDMTFFRRFASEVVLESPPGTESGRWVSLRKTSVRCGVVNPLAEDARQDPYRLHKVIRETAPYFLSITPLDIDYLELMFGFDLVAAGNHDAIVFDAILGGSAFARCFDPRDGVPSDCQPILGFQLGTDESLRAQVEVKTRTRRRMDREGEYEPEALSIFLSLRHYGPFDQLERLSETFNTIRTRGEDLLATRVVPNLVVPIREAIGSIGA